MTEQIDLNEHHRRRLLVSCQYVDGLLSSIENAIAENPLTVFPKYIQDINVRERAEIRKLVARLRSQLLEFLRHWQVTKPGPAIPARHSVLTSLAYIDIAVEELKPRYMGGYGPVPPVLAPELENSVEDLQKSVKAIILELKERGQSDSHPRETNKS